MSLITQEEYDKLSSELIQLRKQASETEQIVRLREIEKLVDQYEEEMFNTSGLLEIMREPDRYGWLPSELKKLPDGIEWQWNICWLKDREAWLTS